MSRSILRRGRPGWWPLIHLLLMAVGLVLVWGAISVNLWRQHRSALHEAIAATANLSLAFAENTERTIEVVDQTLLAVREAYGREGRHFDLQGWARARSLLKSPQVQIAIADRHGAMVLSTLGPVDGSINLSDRRHFQIEAAAPGDSLYISAPVMGRASGRLSIQFVRKLIAADGSFDGIVVVSIDPYDLSRFYEMLSIGHGAISLMNLDGVLLARAPEGEDMVGHRLYNSAIAQVRSGPDSGSFTDTSELDGVTRIFSYRRLDDVGLLLLVGLADTDVFRAYRLNRILNFTVGALLSAGLVAISLLAMRQTRRLLRSREALGVTLENIAQGIEMIDPDGAVPVINSRAIELLGLPAALMETRPDYRTILEWQLASGEFGDRETWSKGLAAMFEAGGVVSYESTYERIRPDGTVLEVRTKPMTGGGAVRTFTDITERKRTEAALAAARDAAEINGRARTEFLAMMSHEIRTPMNSIIGFTGLLMEMPLSQTAQHYIHIIRRSGEHLLRLINDVLDLSKLDAGRLRLEEEPFDLHAEIRHSVDLLTAQAREKHLALDVDISPIVPQRIRGDAGRLRQILINLIGNAIKFTSMGEVRLSVTVQQDGFATPRLAFSVTDTGIGIPAEKLGVLFDQFAQADSSVSRQYGGTGLGLAICRRLVEQMGGDIGVRSEVGHGSTFHFELPLRLADADAPPPSDIPPSYRILLADDSSTNRTVLARMMERQGHRVDTVANGLEAVQAVRTTPYDLVVMDVVMPEMGGLQATETIRRLPGRPGQVPVIGLTAYAAGCDGTDCFASGMNGCMTKPVTAVRLGQAIAEAMARAQTAPR